MKNKNSGSIELICGPMFSGKTSQLMNKCRRLIIAKQRVLVLNFTFDNRYSDDEVVSSHDQVMLKCKKVQMLGELSDIYQEYDVIAIDEGQFFKDIVEMSNLFANSGKQVIIAALDADFRMKPFGNIHLLMACSEKITKLHSVCVNCHYDAAFTKRTTNETEIEVIGSSDKYEPVCRKCFYLHKIEQENQVKMSPKLKSKLENSVLMKSSSSKDSADSDEIINKLEQQEIE